MLEKLAVQKERENFAGGFTIVTLHLKQKTGVNLVLCLVPSPHCCKECDLYNREEVAVFLPLSK